ncbi:MAG TPA: 6-carboxytetrahydropterin synthase [Bryobacteraceae bacterium]|jgi:6-pyruvoyltetrahydropterin/6-carboxytetrahydropterin synthase
MVITRKAEFSASHVCRVDSLSEAENRKLFGEEAHPNGHGHNYILEVSVEGQIDPVTGMVMNLSDLREILDQEIVQPMDHRFLNKEVPPFDKIVPTTANVAREIWQRLQKRFAGTAAELVRVRLHETPELYVDVTR